MAEAAKWYVLHTYSAYENTVKATIEKTVESRNLQDQILAISIPTETVTVITVSGVSKTYERKIYPGYVLTPDTSSKMSAVLPASSVHPAMTPSL